MYYARLLSAVLIVVFVSLRIEAEDCENYDENGSCMEECPQDKVKYNPPCDEPALSQKTCREPLTRTLGMLCDYVRCDCPEPKLWDEATEKCVVIEECPKQSNVTDEIKVQN